MSPLNKDHLPWLPPCQFRLSSRAKHLSLSMNRRGLELVLPEWASEDQALKFAREKKKWILRHWQSYQGKHRDLSQEDSSLTLKALSQRWQYQVSERNGAFYLLLFSDSGEYTFSLGHAAQQADIDHTLTLWLKDYARQYFKPCLDQLTQETSLTYKKLYVRNQVSCWGSCSASNHISLNLKLLFVPEKVARYVMIHELCHTKHRNHSTSFWRLVSRCMRDYKQHNAYLRHAEKDVPGWLYG